MYRPERGHRVSSARNGSVTHQVPQKAAAGATVAFAKASSSGGPAIILYSNVKRFELGLLAQKRMLACVPRPPLHTNPSQIRAVGGSENQVGGGSNMVSII